MAVWSPVASGFEMFASGRTAGGMKVAKVPLAPWPPTWTVRLAPGVTATVVALAVPPAPASEPSELPPDPPEAPVASIWIWQTPSGTA